MTLSATLMSTCSITRRPSAALANLLNSPLGLLTVATTRHPRCRYSCASPSPMPREAPTRRAWSGRLGLSVPAGGTMSLNLETCFIGEGRPALKFAHDKRSKRRHVDIHREICVAFELPLDLGPLDPAPNLLIEPVDDRRRKISRPGDPGPDRPSDIRMAELGERRKVGDRRIALVGDQRERHQRPGPHMFEDIGQR